MSVGGFLKVFVYVSRKMLLSSASFPFSTILTINNCRWRVHVQYKLNKVCSKSWILKRCFPRDYKIKKRRITTTCFLNCSWVLLQFRLLQKLTSRSSNKCKKKNHVKGMSNPTRKALPCFLGNERREREERNWKVFFSKDCLAAREVQLKMETEFFITCPSFFFFPSVKTFFSKVKAFCIFLHLESL